MKSRTTTNLDVLVIIGSLLLTQAMLFLAMELRQILPFGRTLEPGAEIIPAPLFVIVGAIWFVMLLIFSIPQLVRNGRLIDLLWRLISVIGLSSLTFAGTLYLSFRSVSRLYFVYFVILDLIVLILFYIIIRILVSQQRQRTQTHSRILVAGTGNTGRRIARAISRQWLTNDAVVGFLDTDNDTTPNRSLDGWPILGTLESAPSIIKQHAIDEMVIALPLEAHPRVVKLVRRLQSTAVHIRLVPDFLDFAVMRASVDYLEGLPIVGLRVPAISEEARIAKRLFDIIVSLLLLIILSPLLAVVALLIRLDSPGSAIYRTERVGENGQLFRMYKFRTMVQNAEQQWKQVAVRHKDGTLSFKQPDDPRITYIGRWLRRTSLDELPQLVNVLRGDMSLVGPRPELPLIVNEEYEPWQWSRFTVPQGMTGWWQVNRRGFEHQHLCTADDLYYIQNYSLWLDVQILFRTIFVVVNGQGAY